MPVKIHIATSREIGKLCKEWAAHQGHELVDPDTCDIFISVLYDQILKEDYIQRHKCFNLHPGILPWYRGSGAYSWAILNGEFETGATLHEIDKDIDHGKVIDIRRFPIAQNDTAESLYKKAERTIFDMFIFWLSDLIKGNYTSLPQFGGKIYYRKDLEEAKDITRIARAFHFTGKEQAYYYNQKGEKIYLKYA